MSPVTRYPAARRIPRRTHRFKEKQHDPSNPFQWQRLAACWPLSRKQYPKQFLASTGDDTLFQQTIKRLAFDGMQAPLLVCNWEHRFIVQEQLEAQNLASQAILLEPFGATAPAVAIAAMKLVAEGRDELLLILPHADHVIEDQRAFQQALALATNTAEGRDGALRHSRQPPRDRLRLHPARAPMRNCRKASARCRASSKPDEARAREFVAAGGYYWNSGMFLFAPAATWKN